MDEHGEMKQEAYNLAAYAVEQFVTEMEISKHIKAQFDEKYGPTWHCIVGSDFKLPCTHEAKHFIFFYHGKTAVATIDRIRDRRLAPGVKARCLSGTRRRGAGAAPRALAPA